MIRYDWQERFDSLKKVGERYSQTDDFALYGTYCLLKEKGVRKQAYSALHDFVKRCRSLTTEKQRDIVSELCTKLEMDPRNFAFDQALMPKPLADYLFEVAQQWNDEDSSNPRTWMWLRALSNDSTYSFKALEIHPNDEMVLLSNISPILNYVDYQMHHVQDGGFVGSTDDTEESLAYLAGLAMRLPVGKRKQNILEEIKYYKSLLSAWKEYMQTARLNSFPVWARLKGYEFQFHESYYYQK